MFTLPVTLGTFTLQSFIKKSGIFHTYMAEQVSMSRDVILDVVSIHEAEPSVVEQFIADAQAKATFFSSSVTAIYEVVRVHDYWLLAKEVTTFKSIAIRMTAGEVLSIHSALLIIESVAKLCLQLDARGMNSSLLSINEVLMDDAHHIRIENPTLAGKRPSDQTDKELVNLGIWLPDLIQSGVPGYTRLCTLCAWLKDGRDDGSRLSSETVISLVASVKEQLCLPLDPTASLTGTIKIGEGKNRKKWFAVGGVILCLLIVVIFTIVSGSSNPAPVVKRAPAKPKPSFSQTLDNVSVVSVDGALLEWHSHEVTIGQYARFLDALAALPEPKKYDSPDQPSTVQNHEPKDWAAILVAAKSGTEWCGRKLNMRSPVSNISQWNAMAYANWKGGAWRLPTADEWEAVHSSVATKVMPDAWGDVDGYKGDYDAGTRLAGVASGVKEWTSTREKDPQMPYDSEKCVLCGSASDGVVKPKLREYVPDGNFTAPTVGFRLCAPARK